MGCLGRGTHYSVLRSVEWLDVTIEPLAQPHIHDFAVIWDEDHDTRVIEAIERLYMAGLLACVQFIGERKGTLSVIVAARVWSYMKMGFDTYKKRVEEAISSPLHGDYCPVDIGIFDRSPGSYHQRNFVSLINAEDARVEPYCMGVDVLWSLGAAPWNPGLTVLHRASHDGRGPPALPFTTG